MVEILIRMNRENGRKYRNNRIKFLEFKEGPRLLIGGLTGF